MIDDRHRSPPRPGSDRIRLYSRVDRINVQQVTFLCENSRQSDGPLTGCSLQVSNRGDSIGTRQTGNARDACVPDTTRRRAALLNTERSAALRDIARAEWVTAADGSTENGDRTTERSPVCACTSHCQWLSVSAWYSTESPVSCMNASSRE